MALFYKRRYRDSGNIILSNDSSVTSNSIFVFDVDDRFKPYEQISIINNSSSDIAVCSNYKTDFSIIVPKGNQRILDIVIEDLRFKNLGTDTITANQIKANIRHTGNREKDKIKDKIQMISQVAMIKNLF